MTSIEREIYFFRIDAGNDASGKPISFDPVPTLEYIDNLQWQGPKSRYYQDDKKITGCWIDSKKMPCKLRLGTIRRTDFPSVEELGEISPLELSENSGLLDQTHIVFLGDDIVGCDYNFYGPRITRLAYYFSDKAVGIAPPILNLTPLLRKDIYNQLQQFKSLRLFHLRIRPPFAEVIKESNDSLDDSFKAAVKAGNADDVELILRASNQNIDGLSMNLISTAIHILRHPSSQFDTKTFKITGFNKEKQENVTLDLLSDKLVVKKSVLKADRRSRGVNNIAAYNAIISAYNEIKQEIEDSASVIL
jgi:hypothetical protein